MPRYNISVEVSWQAYACHETSHFNKYRKKKNGMGTENQGHRLSAGKGKADSGNRQTAQRQTWISALYTVCRAFITGGMNI